jgi:8-amino-7-oxononanoate synthase
MDGRAARLGESLAELRRDKLTRTRRVLDSPQGAHIREDGRALVNFSSNDYLGLANHPALRQAAHRAIDAYGVGAGASALVSGHMRPHQEAEERFAQFTGLPRAILFASGYAANLGVLSALGGRECEVFSDELNHACLIDGARLSRGTVTRFAHRDLDALSAALARSRAATRIVATDAVFSMDGDLADVPRLAELCERHDAWLLLDDAHGIGVTGRGGRGTLTHFGIASPRIAYMATLGKALGGYGALVAGDATLIEWLLQRARTYIYSTALPPMAAAVACCALQILEENPSIVARLHENIALFHLACARLSLPVPASKTAIQPLIAGSAARALDLAALLGARGMRVPAIRPPTVPEGTSRLRISLSAAHSPAEIEALAAALAEAFAA